MFRAFLDCMFLNTLQQIRVTSPDSWFLGAEQEFLIILEEQDLFTSWLNFNILLEATNY